MSNEHTEMKMGNIYTCLARQLTFKGVQGNTLHMKLNQRDNVNINCKYYFVLYFLQTEFILDNT